jgi:hypothetical protein
LRLLRPPGLGSFLNLALVELPFRMRSVAIDVVKEGLRMVLARELAAPMGTFAAAVEQRVAAGELRGVDALRRADVQRPYLRRVVPEGQRQTDLARFTVDVWVEDRTARVHAGVRAGRKQLQAGERLGDGLGELEQGFHERIRVEARRSGDLPVVGGLATEQCALDEVLVCDLEQRVGEHGFENQEALRAEGVAPRLQVHGGHPRLE